MKQTVSESVIKYDFRHLQVDISNVKHKMSLVGYVPDVIIGLSRGGLIPAVILSHSLGVPMVPVDWSLRDGQVKHSFDTNQFADKEVLVVDDILDSGATLDSLYRETDLVSKANNVRTAALIYNLANPIRADFYGRVIDRRYNKEWFSFFWEDIDSYPSF